MLLNSSRSDQSYALIRTQLPKLLLPLYSSRERNNATALILAFLTLSLCTLYSVKPIAAAAESIEVVGNLSIGVAEDFPSGTSTWYMSVEADGIHYPLPSSDTPPLYAHGSRVSVTGDFENEQLDPTTIAMISAPPIAGAAALRAGVIPSTETLGAQRTLVTLVHFTNDPSTPFTTTDVNSAILDETNLASTASFIREGSYDRAWLTGSTIGWLAAGYDDSLCYLPLSASVGTPALITALDPMIDFSQVDRWVIVIPFIAACGFSGFSSLGKENWVTDEGTLPFSRIIMNGYDPASTPRIMAHELGHSIGALQHSVDYECGVDVVRDDCPFDPTTTDHFAVMSTSSPFGHYTASDKDALNWFDTDVVDVPGGGGAYSLEPYSTASTGTKILRIPVGWALDDLHLSSAYYVSFRTDDGFDAIFPELATIGAMVHIDGERLVQGDPAVVGQSRLLDMSPNTTTQSLDSADVLLGVGQTFSDAEHGITIQVTGMTAGNLDVTVGVTQYCGNGAAEISVGETCDGSDLLGATCESIGRTSGTLACASDCQFDKALCGAERCGPGHVFDDALNTCTATILMDASARDLWANREFWSDVRPLSFASKALINYPYRFMLNFQRFDRSWIYRLSMPFDTSTLPDGVAIQSARLDLQVLREGYPAANSHPTSADQLVLVEATLLNAPIAEQDDFDTIGALDNPTEGAPRVDIGDVDQLVDFPISFPMNIDGISWIDDTGYTLLGLRGAYDVDDVTIPGAEPELRLYLRSEASPLTGPRLVIDYTALPEPGFGLGCVVGGIGIALLASGQGRSSTRPRRPFSSSGPWPWSAAGIPVCCLSAPTASICRYCNDPSRKRERRCQLFEA